MENKAKIQDIQNKFKKLLINWESPYSDKSGKLMNAIKYNEKLKFKEDLGFDSLDEIEFLMEVEKVFNIGIPDGKAQKVKTIGDAIKILSSVL